jgi:hypothetical protein
MSTATLTFDDFVYTITLLRNGERVSHVFRDHYLTIHELEENGRGPIYYIIAQDYGTGEETPLFLKDKEEFEALRKDMSRDPDEATNFKKSVEAYKRQIGKDFVKAVEAARCRRFCDESLKKAEAALDAAHEVSDEDLKELCKPLEAKTDPLRLKELEKRFPGATMVFSTRLKQGTVKYVYEDLYEDESANHMISSDLERHPCVSFKQLCSEKPHLMAEWRGMYIDLTHLI